MSSSPFNHFIELVQFDQAMQKSIKDIEKKDEELAQQKEQERLIQEESNQLKQLVHDAQKSVHHHELEMKKLDAREAELKQKLDEISNVKEYAGLKKELDAVQATQLKHEETLVSAWNQLETAQRTLGQKDPELEGKIKEIAATIEKNTQEKELLQQQLEHAKQTRPEKIKQVNPEWLEKYEMMQGRVSNPVVEVVQGGCGGCFYAIPGKDLSRLKNKALLQCNSCYRFIYDPAVLKIEAPSAEQG